MALKIILKQDRRKQRKILSFKLSDRIFKLTNKFSRRGSFVTSEWNVNTWGHIINKSKLSYHILFPCWKRAISLISTIPLHKLNLAIAGGLNWINTVKTRTIWEILWGVYWRIVYFINVIVFSFGLWFSYATASAIHSRYRKYGLQKGLQYYLQQLVYILYRLMPFSIHFKRFPVGTPWLKTYCGFPRFKHNIMFRC